MCDDEEQKTFIRAKRNRKKTNQKQRGANWVNIKNRDGLSLAVRLIIKIP